MAETIRKECKPLEQAILEHLTTPELYTEYDGCTLGGLITALQGDYEEDVWEMAQALIADRKAYVAVPLALVDLDTYILPVCWTVGVSDRAHIATKFGPAHGITAHEDGETLTFDLYVENVSDADYAQPPAPYAARNQADEERPAHCAFPYTAIWPPEALQVAFAFDQAGILTRFDFSVGNRLT